MPMYRFGALHVVEDTGADKDALQRELQLLDRRLFLERQITLAGEDVWCVVLTLEGDEPPATILEWRGASDEPIPLSSGIVEKVRRMMSRDARSLAKDVARRNEEMIERKRQESMERYRDIAIDWERGLTRSTLLPRSQSLMLARARRRNG